MKSLEIRTIEPNNKEGGGENRIKLSDAFILCRFAFEVRIIILISKYFIVMVRERKENT